MFRWDSIEDLEKTENIEWAIGMENDALNIVRHPKHHKEQLDRVNRRIEDMKGWLQKCGENVDDNLCIKNDMELLEIFKWVEAHKDRYFYSTYC